MSVQYAPRLEYLCDDPSCCPNGCPIAYCRYCGKDWPCPDYRANHTAGQIAVQERWMERKWD